MSLIDLFIDGYICTHCMKMYFIKKGEDKEYSISDFQVPDDFAMTQRMCRDCTLNGSGGGGGGSGSWVTVLGGTGGAGGTGGQYAGYGQGVSGTNAQQQSTNIYKQSYINDLIYGKK